MAFDQLVHIVVDSSSTRSATAGILEGAGITVRQYPSAAAILVAPLQLAGDCIVADLRMPRMDGLELLRRLRALGVTIPIVIVMGDCDVATAVRAMKLGAYDVIEKHALPTALLVAVRGAIRAKPLRASNKTGFGALGGDGETAPSRWPVGRDRTAAAA